jgi:hypothetical protein
MVKQQGIAHDKTLTAIKYFINQYDMLIRYYEDGRLFISNILFEPIAKFITIARKNFLFVNTQSDTTAAAKIYVMVLTALYNGLKPVDRLPHGRTDEETEHHRQ